jgi:hypothetical protein
MNTEKKYQFSRVAKSEFPDQFTGCNRKAEEARRLAR